VNTFIEISLNVQRSKGFAYENFNLWTFLILCDNLPGWRRSATDSYCRCGSAFHSTWTCFRVWLSWMQSSFCLKTSVERSYSSSWWKVILNFVWWWAFQNLLHEDFQVLFCNSCIIIRVFAPQFSREIVKIYLSISSNFFSFTKPVDTKRPKTKGDSSALHSNGDGQTTSPPKKKKTQQHDPSVIITNTIDGPQQQFQCKVCGR
jgi:hypothetical protein